LKLPHVRPNDRKLIYEPPLIPATKRAREKARARVNRAVEALEYLEKTTEMLRDAGKVPLMLGGEHLVSLWPLRGVAREEPVVLQFDAHMDMKAEYLDVKYSHTTPMYHALYGDKPITSKFVQIGIRQGSRDEEENARGKDVVVFDAWRVRGSFSQPHKPLTDVIEELTKGKKVYIPFDIA